MVDAAFITRILLSRSSYLYSVGSAGRLRYIIRSLIRDPQGVPATLGTMSQLWQQELIACHVGQF